MEGVIGQVVFDEQGAETQLIHYAYLTGKWVFVTGKRVPQHVIACHPNGKAYVGWQRSGETAAVNCPRCMATQRFKDAAAQLATIKAKK